MIVEENDEQIHDQNLQDHFWFSLEKVSRLHFHHMSHFPFI
jgi:hypothetical protein